MPAGFRYAPDVIDAAEEARPRRSVCGLAFREFEFHGFLGKRRVVSFGSRYDYNGGGLRRPRRYRRSCCRCASAQPHSPGLSRTTWRRPSSPNTGRAQPSAGIATGRSTAT